MTLLSPRRAFRSDLRRPYAGAEKAVCGQSVPLSTKIFLFVGFLILSGALQRPIGGDVIEGTPTAGIAIESNFAMAVVGMIFYAWCGVYALRYFDRVKVPTSALPLVYVAALALASTIWSEMPILTLTRAAGVAGCTLFSLVALSMVDTGEMRRMLENFSIFLIAVTAVVAVTSPGYAFHSDTDIFVRHAGLLRGTFIHKNSLARVLCLLVVILYYAIDRSRTFGILKWSAIILGVGMLAATDSAKIAVSMPLGIVAAHILTKLGNSTFRYAAVGFVVIAIATVSFTGLAEALLSGTAEAVGRDATFSGRTLIWQAAIEDALKSPILGSGYAAAWPTSTGLAVWRALGFDPGHAHNGYIMTIVDLGLVGVALMGFFLASAFIRLMGRQSGGDDALLKFQFAWFFVFVANNMAGSFMVQSSDIYWFTLVIMAGFLDKAVKPITPRFAISGNGPFGTGRHRSASPSNSGGAFP